MKSLLKFCKVLNFNDLLLVNGGYGGGSGGGGGGSTRSGYGGGSGGSSSSKSVSSKSVRSSYSGSCGGFFAGDSSSSRSTLSARGYSSCSGLSTINLNSYSGCSGGYSGSSAGRYGTSVYTVPYSVDIEDGEIVSKGVEINEKGVQGVGKTISSLFENLTAEQKKALSDYISEAVKKDPGEYVLGVNDCDHYVQQILEEAGYDISTFWGDASAKNCDDHISILGSELSIEPSKGWNIVLMDGGKVMDNGKKANSHAALIYVNEDGSCTISQQTHSDNTSKTESYTSVSAFESAYIYSGYHYFGTKAA